MKTFNGFEAIDVATRYGAPLYDTYYGNEVTVAEARQFVESRRDPEAFCLWHWPETDAEAEEVVLSHVHHALESTRDASGKLSDVMAEAFGPLMHPVAAELAAQRLAERFLLDLQAHEDEYLYRLPQNTVFTEEFLEYLSNNVCEECAHLRLGASYHASCLRSLLDALQKDAFHFDEATRQQIGVDREGPLTRFLRPGIGLLARTVSETKSRWQKALRPMFAGEEKGTDASAWSSPERELEDSKISVNTAGVAQMRHQVTKADIIAYLQSVEIVDERAELARLQATNDALEAQRNASQAAYRRVEEDRDDWKRQYQKLQRDMDTLLEAMQIAKRRVSETEQAADV